MSDYSFKVRSCSQSEAEGCTSSRNSGVTYPKLLEKAGGDKKISFNLEKNEYNCGNNKFS